MKNRDAKVLIYNSKLPDSAFFATENCSQDLFLPDSSQDPFFFLRRWRRIPSLFFLPHEGNQRSSILPQSTSISLSAPLRLGRHQIHRSNMSCSSSGFFPPCFPPPNKLPGLHVHSCMQVSTRAARASLLPSSSSRASSKVALLSLPNSSPVLLLSSPIGSIGSNQSVLRVENRRYCCRIMCHL